MKVALLRSRIHILFVVALFAPWLAVADAPAKPPKAAIASAHQLASEAGMEILKQGGNAFDAAVAVSAALAVVEPSSSGLGGGGFWLLHRASDKFETMVDAREVAPLAATRDMFLDEKGNVVPGRSTATALAAGIPGEAAGWAHMATKYGRLPLKTSLAAGDPAGARGISAQRALARRHRSQAQSVQGGRRREDLSRERRSAGGRHGHQAAGARADADGARGARSRRLLQRPGRKAHGRRRAQARAASGRCRISPTIE